MITRFARRTLGRGLGVSELDYRLLELLSIFALQITHMVLPVQILSHLLISFHKSVQFVMQLFLIVSIPYCCILGLENVSVLLQRIELLVKLVLVF